MNVLKMVNLMLSNGWDMRIDGSDILIRTPYGSLTDNQVDVFKKHKKAIIRVIEIKHLLKRVENKPMTNEK